MQCRSGCGQHTDSRVTSQRTRPWEWPKRTAGRSPCRPASVPRLCAVRHRRQRTAGRDLECPAGRARDPETPAALLALQSPQAPAAPARPCCRVDTAPDRGCCAGWPPASSTCAAAGSGVPRETPEPAPPAIAAQGLWAKSATHALRRACATASDGRQHQLSAYQGSQAASSCTST